MNVEFVTITIVGYNPRGKHKKYFLKESFEDTNLPPILPNVGDYISGKFVYYHRGPSDTKPKRIIQQVYAILITSRHILQDDDNNWHLQLEGKFNEMS